jgi:sulfofructose kinase
VPAGLPRSPDRSPARDVFSGAATFDTIFRLDVLPKGPGKVLPSDAVQVAHGMASSAAAAAAKLGGASLLFARVGADAIGDKIVEDLSAAGIDCTYVRRVEGARSPLCAVLVDATGERLVVPFYDPKLDRSIDWLPLDRVAAADAALVDVRWPEGATAVLKAARAAGIPAVLDADVGAAEAIVGLAGLATHAVFSEPAATIVTGEAEPQKALRALGQRFGGFLAVTAGPEGCFWLERDSGAIRQLRPPPVVAVDTLAAGDVFHGAFTLAVAEGEPIPRAIACANAAAALKCRTFGGRLGAPTRGEVLSVLAAEGVA